METASYSYTNIALNWFKFFSKGGITRIVVYDISIIQIRPNKSFIYRRLSRQKLSKPVNQTYAFFFQQ